MPRPLPSLAAAEWTAELALRLERAASALARPDARIGTSPLAEIWIRRAAWVGLARVLQVQGEEIEEIDIAAAGSHRADPPARGDPEGRCRRCPARLAQGARAYR